MKKTKFEYLGELPYNIKNKETERLILKEIAYQLKRIADNFEKK